MSDAIRWYHEKQTLPGYAELTAAHEALNMACAEAEIEPGFIAAMSHVGVAYHRWVQAFTAWHDQTTGRMP